MEWNGGNDPNVKALPLFTSFFFLVPCCHLSSSTKHILTRTFDHFIDERAQDRFHRSNLQQSKKKINVKQTAQLLLPLLSTDPVQTIIDAQMQINEVRVG